MNNLMRMLGSAMIAATVVISVSASANAQITFNSIWEFNAIDGATEDTPVERQLLLDARAPAGAKHRQAIAGFHQANESPQRFLRRGNAGG